MTLHLAGSAAPLGASDLRGLLARGSVWVWVGGGASELAPFVQIADALELVGDGAARLVITEQAGLAAPALRPGVDGPVLAGVRQIWRAHRGMRLDRAPWSALLGRPAGWRLAERAAALAARAEDFVAQLNVATPPATERVEADASDDATMLEAYARAAAEGLSDTEQELARRHLRAGDRVLDVGCGTGREAFGFAARGLRVTGVDVSPAAIAWAKGEAARRGLDLPFHVMPLSALDFPARSFDVVFVSSDVYASTPGRAQRVAALRRCRELVGDGGRCIVPAQVDARASTARRVLEASRGFLARMGRPTGEPGDRFVRVGMPDGPQRRAFRHQFTDEAAVRAELAEAGLAVVDQLSCYWITRAPGAPQPRFRRRADVAVEADTGGARDDLLLVQLGDGVAFALNGTGRRIWDLVGDGLTLDEIAARLHRATGAPVERVRADAAALLEELADRRLLDRCEP